MTTLFQVILFSILLYFCVLIFAPIIGRVFFKSWINKIQKDLHKKSTKKDNYKQYQKGDTEVSYKKNKNVDPGGEYVDFEELNDDE